MLEERYLLKRVTEEPMQIRETKEEKFIKELVMKYKLAKRMGMDWQAKQIKNRINVAYTIIKIKEKVECKNLSKRELNKFETEDVMVYDNSILPTRALLRVEQVQNAIKDTESELKELGIESKISGMIAYRGSDPIFFIHINAGQQEVNLEVDRWK